ncbi:MAG: methylated-DNA--[protein]-cysteine S-methyltransferase [Nitrospiraceae bacterium]|nr:methylated-DNA--[protein]-cysteine S-methyltransferase [Nitrospiraceae bacterium]
MSFYYDRFESPVGPLYLLMKYDQLARVSILLAPSGFRQGKAARALTDEFRKYFEGALDAFTYPLAPLDGTAFERGIWLALREIPYGQTRSYKWLAARAGHPGAARAAGRALAKNPLPIVLPCHRVIESDGSLGGYSPELAIKRRLLEAEYYHSIHSR